MYQIIKSSYRPDTAFTGLLILLISAWCMQSCTTREPGCLDIAASNFDLDADRPCDDCCTYPSLTLTLTQKWDDRNFNLSDLLFDKNNQPYKIQDLRYFLSSWSWSDAEQQVYTIDSLSISCEAGDIRYTPDILTIDPRQFVYTLGTIRLSPSIISLMFRIGLPPQLSCVEETREDVPPALSDESPLWDSLAMSRAAMRLVLQRDTSMPAFDTLFIHTTISRQVDYNVDFLPGFDPKLKLTVNYALWFEDADVLDLNSFSNSILSNIDNSVFRTP